METIINEVHQKGEYVKKTQQKMRWKKYTRQMYEKKLRVTKDMGTTCKKVTENNTQQFK